MRIVVVGAGGLVGRAVVRAAQAKAVELSAFDRSACDVTNPEHRRRVLRGERPDAVIFCAAATDVDAVGASAAATVAARAVNVDAPAAWAREAETWFLSSNFVFDGPGPHEPHGPTHPRSAYAAQKVEAEVEVRRAGGHVVRIGWVYGEGGRTFASTLAARLRVGETVRAIHDVLVQPTHADDVAEALLHLPRGVTHLAGRGETSWYGFALATWARVGAGRVEPVRMSELGLGPRPRDARLHPALLPGWTERLKP